MKRTIEKPLNMFQKKLILSICSAIFFFVLSAQPIISSFSPALGPVGTSVTINGSNFSTTPTNNIVFFGAVKANVSAATASSLTVTVPVGATYQPITVTVNGLTGYSAKPFVVTFPDGILTKSSFFASYTLDDVTNIETEEIAGGDFDGDGKNDIAVVDRLNNTLSIYKNTSTLSSVSFNQEINYTTGIQPVSLATGDFYGDGKLDIAVTNQNDNTV